MDGVCLQYYLTYYMNELTYKFKNADIGCHIGGDCANNVSYAGDMVLMTPTNPLKNM